MNCHAARAVLDFYADGRLSSRRTAAVVAHLSSCPGCRAAAAPAASAGPARPAPAALKARLLAAAKGDAPRPTAARPLSLLPRDAAGVAWAALALALVALVAGWNGVATQSLERGDEVAGRLP